ncbi:MAG: DUF4212 domain-containing protein [Pseudomonadota bacterium]|jgi:putative solute:sodium symporter small subunit|nr:DUF4212 domain-containing protein [Pseudomonadota bacterium]MEC9458917.1 DUF4212 domain-containing protein [Pseudomonadota bacterium]MED5437125.1 DUF4212 domain-containing protein [Pseudomonadota bacterium]|tara:strand:- start:2290 stop:2553 length:264 start_codon:yes stop_codon:yes gene_type:complete
MDNKKINKYSYWNSNLKIVFTLLLIWFLSSFGAGIIFSDQLDKIKIGGFQIGFWFAQQGSIIIFVILIVVYCFLMNRLDKKFDISEE